MSFFRALPIKTKLIAALAIPLMVLALFAALQVSRSATDAQQAQDQLDQVDRVVVFTELTVIVRNEFDAQLGFDTTPEQLDAARAGTDQAVERLLSEGPNFGFTTQELESVRSIQGSLTEVRNILGSNPRTMVADAAAQTTNGVAFSNSTSILGAVTDFEALVGQAAALVQIDPNVLIDPSTALTLQSLQLALELDTTVRSEGLHYMLLSQFPSEAVNDEVVALQTRNRSESELLQQQLAAGDVDSQAQLQDLTSSEVWEQFQSIRDRVALVGPGESLAFDTQVVSETFSEVSAGLDTISEESINELFSTAFLSRADANQWRLLTIATALAVLGLVSLILFSLYRSIRGPIVSLTDRSLEIANVELPELVSLMRSSGAETEIPEIEPITRHTDDEIGELVTAFNGMHQTAVTLAAEQAGSRRTVGDMFINLGRRNQKLLIRMLGELDGIEAQEQDPERLEALYRVDRLATRMRRNAESLLVLAGAEAARKIGQPVPLSEVARSAVSEVERFDRVRITVQGDAVVSGAVAVDVAHLLAELVENALQASPEESQVDVTVASSRNRHRIAIRDEGLGLTETQLELANERIHSAATAEESPSKQLGLFVVGRLAARHGISVRLVERTGFGVGAVVELPPAVMVADSGTRSGDTQQQVTSPRVALGSSSAPSTPDAPKITDTQPVILPDDHPANPASRRANRLKNPAPQPAAGGDRGPATPAAQPVSQDRPAAQPAQPAQPASQERPTALTAQPAQPASHDRPAAQPAQPAQPASHDRPAAQPPQPASQERTAAQPPQAASQERPAAQPAQPVSQDRTAAQPARMVGETDRDPIARAARLVERAPGSQGEAQGSTPNAATARTNRAAQPNGDAARPTRRGPVEPDAKPFPSPGPRAAAQPSSPFSARRDPGANLPTGVEPARATAPQEFSAPSARKLATSLSAFQKGTKRATTRSRKPSADEGTSQ